jgi:hypothetical protein
MFGQKKNLATVAEEVNGLRLETVDCILISG